MHVRYLNLSVADEAKRAALLKAVEKVLIHGRIVIGPEVDELENKVSELCGVKYGVGVNSGSDAVYLALRSLFIGPGDEVITTCLSWIATANAIRMTGATPVFVDIGEDFLIDPVKIEAAITPRTKAILVVHFTGKICDMDAIQKIADKHRLKLIEDAAQAFGAEYKGRKAGSFGVVNAFSMNPMKVFAACGEAGMVVSDDAEIASLVRMFRYNGTPDRVEAHHVSLNSRLDTIQAAILLERLKWFVEDIDKRRAAADYYNQHLRGIVRVPVEGPDCRDVYYIYNIICQDRDGLKTFLEQRGIETKINHPQLMPHHKAHRSDDGGKWPVGERLVAESLCLPIHEKISQAEQDYIIENVRAFNAGKGQ